MIACGNSPEFSEDKCVFLKEERRFVLENYQVTLGHEFLLGKLHRVSLGRTLSMQFLVGSQRLQDKR